MNNEQNNSQVSSNIPEQYDYNALRDSTANEALKAILTTWGEMSEQLVYSHTATKDEIIEALDAVAMKTMTILSEKKVVDSDMQYIIDSMYSIIQQVFSIVSRLKGEWQNELYARTLGERDPGTGKYAKEYSTIDGLVSALNKIRAEQGDEGNDYFFKKEKGTPETDSLN